MEKELKELRQKVREWQDKDVQGGFRQGNGANAMNIDEKDEEKENGHDNNRGGSRKRKGSITLEEPKEKKKELKRRGGMRQAERDAMYVKFFSISM